MILRFTDICQEKRIEKFATTCILLVVVWQCLCTLIAEKWGKTGKTHWNVW